MRQKVNDKHKNFLDRKIQWKIALLEVIEISVRYIIFESIYKELPLSVKDKA